MHTSDVEQLAKYCRDHLDLTDVHLSDEYNYANLPLCLIDAIYSINTIYTATQNAVKRFCEYFGIQQFKFPNPEIQAKQPEFTIDDLLQCYSQHSVDVMASEIFRNRQRTSTKNGILKADAIFRAAKVLKKYGVNVLADLPKVVHNADFEAEYKSIPGQGNGTSLRYLYTITGVVEQANENRMISRFVSSALNREVDASESQQLLVAACQYLRQASHLDIQPSVLDHLIWRYQREQDR